MNPAVTTSSDVFMFGSFGQMNCARARLGGLVVMLRAVLNLGNTQISLFTASRDPMFFLTFEAQLNYGLYHTLSSLLE